MKKTERQRYIKQLLARENVERQEDFVKFLNDDGIVVTQATISRDIKEMQLVKVPSLGGGYHYSLPVQKQLDTEKKLKRTLKDAYISLSNQDQLSLIKVLPGNGPAISSLIDQMDFPFVFGTIGDDSTILVICRTYEGANELQVMIEKLLTQ